MLPSRGVIYEKGSIYGQSDSSHTQACRGGNASCHVLPRIWYKWHQFLPIAVEIRQNRRITDAPPDDLEAENARLKKMYAEERIKSEQRQDCNGPPDSAQLSS